MQPIERSVSLTDKALAQLRAAIVNGDFSLGQLLSEGALAERLSVSKTPVREALARLRVEGLVTIVPKKGAFVFTLSARQVRELSDLRYALEAAALGHAVQNDPKRLAARLSQIVGQMARARKAKDRRRYLALDTEFHDAIFAACNNQMMVEAYGLILGRVAALRTHLSVIPAHTDLSFGEHERMAELADQGELAAMLPILAEHIGRAKQTYEASIEDISRVARNAVPITRRQSRRPTGVAKPAG